MLPTSRSNALALCTYSPCSGSAVSFRSSSSFRAQVGGRGTLGEPWTGQRGVGCSIGDLKIQGHQPQPMLRFCKCLCLKKVHIADIPAICAARRVSPLGTRSTSHCFNTSPKESAFAIAAWLQLLCLKPTKHPSTHPPIITHPDLSIPVHTCPSVSWPIWSIQMLPDRTIAARS